MCERLIEFKKLAKQKGLDPKCIVCPADKKALCTCPTECALIEILVPDDPTLEIDTTSNVSNFYNKLEKSIAIRQELHSPIQN